MPINKVDSKGIEDGSIATADLADGIVTSAKLENNAVTNAKLSNSSITLFGTSISLGSSATFTNRFVNWQTVKTSGFTAVAGEGYFCNTTSAAFTVTLPSSATRGDTIAIKDYAGTFATNNLTINRSVHNIQGVANNSIISTNRASVVLVYIDSTRGWEFVEESNVANLGVPAAFISATGGTITTSGNFKIHSFTGDGCFVVSTVGNSPTVPTGGPTNVDYLVVAGGGGGTFGGGGGGGAGGYRTTFPSPSCNAGSFPVSVTTYPITVGAGGAGGVSTPVPSRIGINGSSSIFSSITSTGGGRGGGEAGNGAPGGSGGGAGMSNCVPAGTTGGTGNSPPVSPPQGNPGGNSTFPTQASGGGGASAAGSSGGPGYIANGGAGGNGLANSITGCSVTRAGGGGAGAWYTNTGGTGGTGGGGRGAGPCGTPSLAGTANTGGGGGGSTSGFPSGNASAGGKGIVIIRYKFQ